MTAAAAAATPSGVPGSTGGWSAGSASLMSIGEVLALLREDFPDVTISKLRFLEAEGLVEPQRTAAGYRKYSRADVSRLRFVLAAQRDRFLPLRVIREHLAALDDGGQPAAGGHPALTAASRPTLTPVEHSGGVDDGDPQRRFSDGDSLRHDHGGQIRLRREELIQRAGLTDEALRDLEDNGLVGVRSPGWYDGDALVIATVAAALAEYGLGPRHLRAYRSAADREVGLFAQSVAPLARSSTPAARVRAAEALRELTSLSAQLHAALVRIGLRETLGQ